MQTSHKNSLEGHLDHAQLTSSTDYHLSQCSSVCPEDAAAAAMWAGRPAAFVPPPGPFPPGSWMPRPAAWVS